MTTPVAREVIVAGWIDWDPAQRDEVLQHFQVVARKSREEAGCLDYSVSADPELPERVRVFEHWASEQSLHEHLALDHVTQFRAAVAPLTRTGRSLLLHSVATSDPMTSAATRQERP